MGGERNEEEMGFKYGDDETGISRAGITSMHLYAKADHYYSSTEWDPVVSGINGGVGDFSSSQNSSMVMDNSRMMSSFPHCPPGSGYEDMPVSHIPFGRLIRAAEQPENGSQWNKKAVEEFQGDPQWGSDQSQKKQRRDQSKENKESSQSEEAPKENYIHMRARRGQATNSHSLAERVRREKISERMRLLQELVPGCNRITGKAVMLDEIINYVQSLQQQVEFLSMKLATVNPELNIDIDRILAKNLMQSRDRNTPTLGLNSFPGFQGTIPNLCTTANPQYNSLPQTILESEVQSLYQMGFVSNPSAISSFTPNGRLKPEF